MMFKKALLTLLLVLVAVSERVWWDLGPNIELVTLTAVLAGLYLGKRFGLLVAVSALVVSDLLIGNTNIFLFTWSGFAVIGWMSWYLTKFSGAKKILAGGLYGVLVATWFYLYTNFGVWLISGLYPPTLAGLAQSYYMGLPFLRLQAVSNLLLLTGAMTVLELTALATTNKVKLKFNN